GCGQGGVRTSVTAPGVGGRKPESTCSRVLLRAPWGPRSPVPPGPRVMLTSLTAPTLPYQRDTPDSSTTLAPPLIAAPSGTSSAATRRRPPPLPRSPRRTRSRRVLGRAPPPHRTATPARPASAWPG